MVKQGSVPAFLIAALLAAPLSAADAPAKSTPKAKTVQSSEAKAKEVKAAPKSDTKSAPKQDAKISLGDGFIVQGALRVYLGRPATVTLHNARGQQLFHEESSKPVELIPLQGVDAGFLYLTLRAGSLEMTKKLVYAGK